jgi:hypothetical protein
MQMQMPSRTAAASHNVNIASNPMLTPQGFSFPYSMGPISPLPTMSSLSPIAQYPGPYRAAALVNDGESLG